MDAQKRPDGRLRASARHAHSVATPKRESVTTRAVDAGTGTLLADLRRAATAIAELG
jgi:hypothetical protein